MHEIVILVAKYLVALPIVVWVYFLLKLRGSARKKFIIVTVVSGVVAILLVKLATTVHQDPRPFVRDGVRPYFVSSKDNGFPSDHTVLSALLAAVVYIWNKRSGLGLLVVAVLIGTARVISGVHHAQDIIAGLVLAGVSVYLVHVVLRRYTKKTVNNPL